MLQRWELRVFYKGGDGYLVPAAHRSKQEAMAEVFGWIEVCVRARQGASAAELNSEYRAITGRRGRMDEESVAVLADVVAIVIFDREKNDNAHIFDVTRSMVGRG